MVVTVSHSGHLKLTPLSTYRLQKRGGKGRTGMSTKDGEFVTRVFVANTHQPVLFFSNIGCVSRMKTNHLPEGTPTPPGKALVPLIPMSQRSQKTTVLGP